MDVNLQFVESDLADYERPMYKVLKATLEYPADPEAKALKLADDLRFITGWKDDVEHASCVIWQLWSLVLNIAKCIPPDHPWQQSLILALDTLQRRDDSVIEHDENQTMLWRDLPDLGMMTRESWLDPDDDDPDNLARWKNLNSFVARQGTSIELASLADIEVYSPTATLPIWQLRTALEKPEKKGAAMECRLWIATEWIIHYADFLFLEMHPKVEFDKRMYRVVATSELAKDIGPHTPQRWEFWKTRLSKLSAEARRLQVDASIVGRITEALKVMETVERKWSQSQAEGSVEGETDSRAAKGPVVPQVDLAPVESSVEAKTDPDPVESSVEVKADTDPVEGSVEAKGSSS